jgi:hypothetical protein
VRFHGGRSLELSPHALYAPIDSCGIWLNYPGEGLVEQDIVFDGLLLWAFNLGGYFTTPTVCKATLRKYPCSANRTIAVTKDISNGLMAECCRLDFGLEVGINVFVNDIVVLSARGAAAL